MKNVLRIHRQPEGHWVGDGFPVHTVLDYQRHPELSPFLLLDHAGPADFAPADKPRGVGWHPHRGFETVTLVLDGEVDHEDTAGNGGRIGQGEVQWMTAGSGLLHKEMHSPEFTRRGGKFHALQLWVNLPAKSKMTAPRYQTLTAASIPVVDGVRVIAGEYRGAKGPAQTFTPVNLFDVRLRAGQKLTPRPARRLSAPACTSSRAKIQVNGEQAEHAPSWSCSTAKATKSSSPRLGRDRVRDERRADRRAGGRLRPVRDEHHAARSSRRTPTSTPAAWARFQPRRQPHETVLRTRRLLAVAAHRVARARPDLRAEEGQHQGQDHRRRRRLLEGESARLRAGARARQRPDPHRRAGDRAVPRRPEARQRPRAEGGHASSATGCRSGSTSSPPRSTSSSRRCSSRTRPRTTSRSRRKTSPAASTGSTSSSPARTT